MAQLSKSVIRLISFQMVSGAVFGLISFSCWKQSQWHMSLFMAGVHGAVHNNSQHLEAFCKQLKRKTVYPARWIIHALEHVWYAAFVLVSLGWLKSVSSSAPANLSCAVGCVMIHWVPSDCMIVQHRERWNAVGRLYFLLGWTISVGCTISCYECCWLWMEKQSWHTL